MDVKDLAFIAQNSGGHAAAITSALVSAGQVTDPATAGVVFADLQESIFNGALGLLGTDVDGVKAEAQAAADAAAARRAEQAFASPPSGAASSGGRVKVKKQLEGHDVPEWLEKQVEWLIGKGDITAADGAVVEVWDNRRFLPDFGGDRSPKSPWFTTVNKEPGEQYGTGIWPPKRG